MSRFKKENGINITVKSKREEKKITVESSIKTITREFREASDY